MDHRTALELLDWKRRIFELYAYVRASDPADGHRAWCDERDHLFATHPQSPLPAVRRSSFEGLAVAPYDPAARVLGELHPTSSPPARPSGPGERKLRIPSSSDEELSVRRVGRVSFTFDEKDAALDVFWVEGYGGGLFLPFRDATSGTATYGAGRYLYDTIKGADLGTEDGKLVLDFNFAYNPSCAYDPRWSCPLAPPANRLEVAVEAGEKAPLQADV